MFCVLSCTLILKKGQSIREERKEGELKKTEGGRGEKKRRRLGGRRKCN